MKYTMINITRVNATSIYHDLEHQTLPCMRVNTNRKIEYLSFHVVYVAATSTIALAIKALISASRTS